MQHHVPSIKITNSIHSVELAPVYVMLQQQQQQFMR